MIEILINAGYILILIALTIRDILWLRTVFILAHTSFIAYAIASDNRSMAFWNFLFLSINIYHVVRLLRERKPIKLPDSLTDLYQQVFSAMSRREFFHFWQAGTLVRIFEGALAHEGKRQEEVILILDGSAEVIRGGKVVTRLSRGSFVGEMSFLTGENASAQVVTKGPISFISWKQDKLREMSDLNPQFFVKVQSVFGKDLSKKVGGTS